MPVVRRAAARVLPVTPAGEVLLLRCSNPRARSEPFWMAVGGGVEPGESARQAAARELWEETGIAVDPDVLLGPVHRETVTFAWSDDVVEQTQDYYVAHVPRTAVAAAAPDPSEAGSVLGHRWWTEAELAGTLETVLPGTLRAHAASRTLSRFLP